MCFQSAKTRKGGSFAREGTILSLDRAGASNRFQSKAKQGIRSSASPLLSFQILFAFRANAGH